MIRGRALRVVGEGAKKGAGGTQISVNRRAPLVQIVQLQGTPLISADQERSRTDCQFGFEKRQRDIFQVAALHLTREPFGKDREK